jgi:hypothetical protein
MWGPGNFDERICRATTGNMKKRKEIYSFLSALGYSVILPKIPALGAWVLESLLYLSHLFIFSLNQGWMENNGNFYYASFDYETDGAPVSRISFL